MNDGNKGKSPEDWEAAEHINNLKKSLDAGAKNGVCAFHGDQTRANIWMIRHMDIQEKNGKGKKKFKLGPLELSGFDVRDVGRILATLVIMLVFLKVFNLI